MLEDVVPSPQGGEIMQPEQTVSEMVGEVLCRQAQALAAQTGKPLEAALEEVEDTVAGHIGRLVLRGSVLKSATTRG